MDRRAMSMHALLGEYRQLPVEGQKARLAVVQPDGLRAAERDVRRVHLELQVEDVALARRDVPELEGEPAVVARLAHRARLDRVDRHSFGPAGAEDEIGVL